MIKLRLIEEETHACSGPPEGRIQSMKEPFQRSIPVASHLRAKFRQGCLYRGWFDTFIVTKDRDLVDACVDVPKNDPPPPQCKLAVLLFGRPIRGCFARWIRWRSGEHGWAKGTKQECVCVCACPIVLSRACSGVMLMFCWFGSALVKNPSSCQKNGFSKRFVCRSLSPIVPLKHPGSWRTIWIGLVIMRVWHLMRRTATLRDATTAHGGWRQVAVGIPWRVFRWSLQRHGLKGTYLFHL